MNSREKCGCGDTNTFSTTCGVVLCGDCWADHLETCEICQVEQRQQDEWLYVDLMEDEWKHTQ